MSKKAEADGGVPEGSSSPSKRAKAKRPVLSQVERQGVAFTTKDGVQILKPRGKPTHFTMREIREAIESVRRTRE